jgi:hypothetical protein
MTVVTAGFKSKKIPLPNMILAIIPDEDLKVDLSKAKNLPGTNLSGLRSRIADEFTTDICQFDFIQQRYKYRKNIQKNYRD